MLHTFTAVPGSTQPALSEPTDELTAQVTWLGLRVSSHLELSLHSSNEPRLTSQLGLSY